MEMNTLQLEFDSAWAAFRNLHSLRLLPDTLESEWMRGRDSYLAFLIPVTDPLVVGYLREAVRSIEGIPGVEPYPAEYWHITVKGIGFESKEANQPDDVAYADVDGIALGAGEIFAEQGKFDVEIGPLSAFPEVVFAEVKNSIAIRDLNRRILGVMPGLIRYPFDGDVFLPHVSIARFTSSEGLSQIRERLAAQREDARGPTLRIAEVQLVRAHLSEQAPTLERIETYPLA
jgi:2'-5' RNA ligase